jgi:hypothetical protein
MSDKNKSMFLSPNETIAMLGTEEEFLKANPFLDEEHNELLDEKLKYNN